MPESPTHWSNLPLSPEIKEAFAQIINRSETILHGGTSYRFCFNTYQACASPPISITRKQSWFCRKYPLVQWLSRCGSNNLSLVFEDVAEARAFLARKDRQAICAEISARIKQERIDGRVGREVITASGGNLKQEGVENSITVPKLSTPIIGQSPAMAELRLFIETVAPHDVSVLLLGETGVGKDHAAFAIHQASGRACNPFEKLNCAAVPRELLESELFGHERGAFTGAERQHRGIFERAQGGTVFLNEIGELPLELQAKILHVLDSDHAFHRVGGNSLLEADVRLIAATNRNLKGEIASHRFREDLYYRLAVAVFEIPPLRERKEDIPVLARHILAEMAEKQGKPLAFSAEAEAILSTYPWPGNVRELQNVLQRVAILAQDGVITPDLFLSLRNSPRIMPVSSVAAVPPERSPNLKEIAKKAAAEAERRVILEILTKTSWNRVRAAKILLISYRALLYKIKELGIVQAGNTGSGVAEKIYPDSLTREEALRILQEAKWRYGEAARKLGIGPHGVGDFVRLRGLQKEEKEWFKEILEKAGGNRTKAAYANGLLPNFVAKQARKYEL